MRKKVVTFGEIMMRLSPPDFLRFRQARSFDIIYGGTEANVAVSLVNYGMPADFVTRLPENDLGEACIMYLRQFGVGTDKIIRGGDRLGIYFIEVGAAQRGSAVIYDRADSAIATIEKGMIDWRQVLADADWFHWTGISPAVSESLADVCLESVQAAKEMGLTVSCDLNYRSKLWKWGKEPADVMPGLFEYCDVVIPGGEQDADMVFGIKAPDKGTPEERHRHVYGELKKRFPNLKTIAGTLRRSISASHNTLSGIMLDGDDFYTGPSYDITHIVDRVGGGDAFMAGLIYGFRAYGTGAKAKQKTLDFAIAADCLKHSIFGDFNIATVEEVEGLMGGDASGRVSR